MNDELEAELVRIVVDRRRRMQEPGRPDYRRYKYSTDLENTISICSNKLIKDPSHQRALYLRASAYLKRGALNEALKDCEKLISLDKDFVGSYYIRGCAYERMGEIDKSILDYTKVLALDPNHVNAAYARGACQNRKTVIGLRLLLKKKKNMATLLQIFLESVLEHLKKIIILILSPE